MSVSMCLLSDVCCQRPLTVLVFVHFPPRSLTNNALCGVRYGQGTYTTEGIVAICSMLKVNSSLTSLSCASQPELQPKSVSAL